MRHPSCYLVLGANISEIPAFTLIHILNRQKSKNKGEKVLIQREAREYKNNLKFCLQKPTITYCVLYNSIIGFSVMNPNSKVTRGRNKMALHVHSDDSVSCSVLRDKPNACQQPVFPFACCVKTLCS